MLSCNSIFVGGGFMPSCFGCQRPWLWAISQCSAVSATWSYSVSPHSQYCVLFSWNAVCLWCSAKIDSYTNIVIEGIEFDKSHRDMIICKQWLTYCHLFELSRTIWSSFCSSSFFFYWIIIGFVVLQQTDCNVSVGAQRRGVVSLPRLEGVLWCLAFPLLCYSHQGKTVQVRSLIHIIELVCHLCHSCLV